MTGEIKTERLLLRSSQAADAHCFYKLVSENLPRISESFPKSAKAAESEKASADYLQFLREEAGKKNTFHLLIFHRQELVGIFFIKGIDWTVPKGELAYFVCAGHEGKGLMREGLKALCNYCFSELKFNKLFLRTLRNNTRSAALAAACGFTKEGVLRNDFCDGNGRLQDVDYFGLLP